jgi:NADH-quinone oxidoreductase subunit N
MISAFFILFVAALLSIVFHRSLWLKPFSLFMILLSSYYTLNHFPIALDGFSINSGISLFEFIVEIVLFAVVLHDDEDSTITQALFLGSASVLLLESESILSFVIAFEAVSIISIVLVSNIKTKEHAEGAVKMFIAAALATAILFLGLAFYVMGGGDLLKPISLDVNVFEKTGLFLMIGAVFYKLTIVPFHSWAVDTYALVRHSHAAILSGMVKTVVVLALYRVFDSFLETQVVFSTVMFATLAVITMTLGNFLALFQKDISKILAYSSIAHAGYMLIAFMAIESKYSQNGILYMSVAYIFMQTAAFLALDIMRKKYEIVTLDDIKGFSKQNLVLSFFFTIQLLSLAGIPLLAGFLSKAVVFYAGVDVGMWYIVLIALLNSALSVGYYAWIIKSIYFDKLESKQRYNERGLFILSQIILFLGTIYFGIYAQSILSL